MVTDRFICGDCEDVMGSMPENSVDLILTSPPYADKRDYGTGMIHADDYCAWFLPKARRMFRVLKSDGSFVLNISDEIVGGYQHLYVFDLLLKLCREIGFHLVRDYIWHNPATPPNVYSRGGMGRTKKSHEYCFWMSKGDTWHFDLDAIRKPYGDGMKRLTRGKGVGNRHDNARPSTHAFDCGKTWADNGGADPGSVIEIANTSSNDYFNRICREQGISHPARFPEKLAEFFILSGSQEGDLVLDPFSGSGTTAAVAHLNNRKFIGIDMNPDYCRLSEMRVHAIDDRNKAMASRKSLLSI